MNGLGSCFAIYLHNIEHGSYALEFFLPVDMKEVADLQNLVQKLNSKEPATVGKTNAGTHCINAKDQSNFSNNDLKNWTNGNTNNDELYVNGVTRNKLDVVTKQRRKHKKNRANGGV
ncbi:hypothetical protein Tco_0199387 [Tanacetum coccineum]